MQARKRKGRPLRASEILTAATDPMEIPKILGWPPALKWPPNADELLTPAATKALQTFMWPLTVDELLTFSPAEVFEKAKEERRKPTTDKLLAWFGERLIVAYRESKASPDPETQRRLCGEVWAKGWNDIQQALAEAYTRKQRANLDNLATGNTVKKQREKKLNARVLADVRKVRGTAPSRQRAVNNITKILCNPKGTKKPVTPKMKHWKYRWSYKKEKREEPFWTIRSYVDRAVKALKPASA